MQHLRRRNVLHQCQNLLVLQVCGRTDKALCRAFSTEERKGTPAILSSAEIIDQAKNLTHLHYQDQFKTACLEFMDRDKHRRTHLKFITAALQKIDEFGLQKDLLTYNRVLDLFPKGRFVNRTFFDAVWPRPTPQMELALNILEKMELEGIRPDDTTYTILLETFGKASFPLQKCQRMGYWFDRYKNVDPYKLPSPLPSDPVELCKIALKRMDKDGSVLQHKVTNSEYVLSSVHISTDPLLAQEGPSLLQVEGPYNLWLQKLFYRYFTLSATQSNQEGTLLSICMCQPNTRDCLQLWISDLLDREPALSKMTIIYNIKEYEVSEDDEIRKLNSPPFIAPPKII